jgi:hypothetical protein
MRLRLLVGLGCACATLAALFAMSAFGRRSSHNAALEASASGSTRASAPDDIHYLDAARPSCPADMVLVDTTFCRDVVRHCTDMEKEQKNHLSICHAFAPEQSCRGEARRVAFCIDRYEYPNRKDARPSRMLDWYQAQATCESKQKRLCWASEWTAACEGPEHTPFPYGWARDHDACNMDNFYIEPKKPDRKGQFFFYSKDREISLPELSRLDQSVPCGSMESCKSGFGLYDMTGNVDEWVVSDEPPREKSRWAGLKGGAWGHVRSQCRPMTTSHEPEFTYYFVGFRCCSDAPERDGDKWAPSRLAAAAPVVAPRDFTGESPEIVSPTGPSKAKFSRTGKTE